MKPRVAKYPAIITATPLTQSGIEYPAIEASIIKIIIDKWAIAITVKIIAEVVKYHLLFVMLIV